MKIRTYFLSLVFLSFANFAVGQTMPGGGGSGGGGTVSVTSVTSNLVINPSPGTSTFTVGATYLNDAQTGTTYTFLAADGGQIVTGNNAAAQTFTLPGSATTGFTAGFSTDVCENGIGKLTIASVSTFSTAAPGLNTGQCASLTSLGAGGYQVSGVSLPYVANNTIMANFSGSSSYPIPVATGGGTTNFLRADGTWAAPGGAVTWPATGSIVVSNSTNSPTGIAEVDGNCVVGAAGVWGAGSCSTATGFPITLGSTSIASGSTTTSLSGLTLASPTFSGTIGGTVSFNNAITFTSSLTSATITGGTGTSSTLTLRSSSNAGPTTDSILLKTGASVTAVTIDTNQKVSFTGQLVAANMTQSSAAQSGTVCFAAAGLTYDATLGCLASLPELKDFHGKIINASAALDKVTPMWASWKISSPEWKGGDHEIQPVFNAREVAAVDKRLVSYGKNGKLRGVRYMEMAAYLWTVDKELKAANNNLERRIEKLEHRSGGR